MQLLGIPTLIAGILLWMLASGPWVTVGIVLTIASVWYIVIAVAVTALAFAAVSRRF